MKPTRLERSVKVDDSTAKVEIIDDEEITTVGAIPEIKVNFVLTNRDIEMMRSISDAQDLPYEAIVGTVIRDALDLYHWNNERIAKRQEII